MKKEARPRFVLLDLEARTLSPFGLDQQLCHRSDIILCGIEEVENGGEYLETPLSQNGPSLWGLPRHCSLTPSSENCFWSLFDLEILQLLVLVSMYFERQHRTTNRVLSLESQTPEFNSEIF